MDSSHSPKMSSSSPVAGMSPRKSLGHSSPLPPLTSDTLQISKRRWLEPSSPLCDLPSLASDGCTGSGEKNAVVPDLHSTITPSKQRIVTSPSQSSRYRVRRTPSLQDRPIPVLSPPSPQPADSENVPIRRVTSPTLLHRRKPGTSEKRTEMNLDLEIALWKQLLSTAQQATQFSKKKNEDARLEGLIVQWRETAQAAAQNLFEMARERVEGAGGVAAFKQQHSSFLFSPADHHDLSSLTEEQREAYEESLQDAEIAATVSKLPDGLSADHDSDDEHDREFTIQDMLRIMGIDPKIVFPDGTTS